MPGTHGQALFDLKEVCAMLSLSESAVRKLVKDGHLAGGHKIPGQRGVRWFRLDLEVFLDRLRQSPPARDDDENSD